MQCVAKEGKVHARGNTEDQPFHREEMPRQAGSCLACQTLGVKLMLSWSSILFVGVAASCLVVLLALERLREKRVRALLLALGRPAIGTVAEYTEGEDGYLVSPVRRSPLR